MSKIQWKGGAMLGPLPPALISCGTVEQPNIFTAAWTGIVNTIPPKTYVSIRPSRHSYGLIKKNRQFVINLTTEQLVRAADFCGVRSGREIDKFKETGLTPEASFTVDCPAVAQSPLSLECRVTDIIPMGSHEMFLADITAVSVDEALIDGTGKLHLERAGLAAYAHGAYFALGKQLGTFGFSVRKKPLNAQKKSAAPKVKRPAPKAEKTAADKKAPAGRKNAAPKGQKKGKKP